MEAARITISLPSSLAKAVEVKAKRDRRSVSSYVAVLLEQDVGTAAAGHQEQLLAAAEEVGFPEAIDALAKISRRKKGQAA